MAAIKFLFANNTASWAARGTVDPAGWPLVSVETGEIRIANGAATWTNLPKESDRLTVANEVAANVMRFGAVADGVTDDTVAFQACMDFLDARGGGTMLIPSGTYAVAGSSKLFLRSNLNIVGDGATLVKASGADYAMFVAIAGTATTGYGASVRNVKVSGLRFQGDLSLGLGGIGCFALHHAENITVERCVFFEVQRGGHTFDMGGCRNIVIRDCEWYGFDSSTAPTAETIQIDTSYVGAVSYPDAVGSYDGLPCVNVTVENCKFLPSGAWPCPNPIGSHTTWENEYHDNIRFLNNEVVDPAEQVSTGDGANAGRNFGTIHMPATKNLIIAGNTFTQSLPNSTRVISVHSMSSGYLATSDPNVSPAAQGAWTTPTIAENIVIRDNTFDGFDDTTTAQEMVWLHGLSNGFIRNVTITGNRFKNGFYDLATISFNGAAIGAQYVDGLLIDSDFEHVQMSVFADTCRRVKIVGCNITETASYGLITSATTDVTVTGCTITGQGRGTQIQTGSGVTFTGNTIRNPNTSGASPSGIVISGVQNQFTVSNNVFATSSTVARGIWLSGTCTNGVVSGNVVTGFTAAVDGEPAGGHDAVRNLHVINNY